MVMTTCRPSPVSLSLGVFLVGLANSSSLSHAQLTAYVLDHPSNIVQSDDDLMDVAAGVVIGRVYIDNGGSFSDLPATWNGVFGPVQPFSVDNARARSIAQNGQIAGNRPVVVNGTSRAHAHIWQSGNETDLHPFSQSLPRSFAHSTDGVNQAGWLTGNETTTFWAAKWSGTAASFAFLDQTGLINSRAFGVRGSEFVGSGVRVINGQQLGRAILWTNGGNSWIDLTPDTPEDPNTPDCAVTGAVVDIQGGQQVGSVNISIGSVDQASLWSGSRESWVNLAPGSGDECGEMGAESRANAVFGGIQVGEYFNGSKWNAVLWQGTAQSYQNLHTLLPPEFESSYALGMDIDQNGTVWIAGWAERRNPDDLSMFQSRSVVWVGTVPPPCTPNCNYDYNQDENVDLLDAQQLAQVVAGVITPDPSWLSGDLNCDENVDNTDAFILANFVASGVCPF